MLFGSTSRRFGTISIFPSIPIATYRIMHILRKVVQVQMPGESTCRSRAVARVSSHRPLVGVVCRISRSGKRMGSVRHRQRLRRHALDLFTASRVDDDSTESNLHVAAGRFVGSERAGQVLEPVVKGAVHEIARLVFGGNLKKRINSCLDWA